MANMLTLEAEPGFETALSLIPPAPRAMEDNVEPVSNDREKNVDETELKISEKKTLVDLAQDVSNWTLHSDHDLHAFLKRYSSELFTRTKDLENSVRDIAADADSAQVRLKNTFNQFLMLSNNQFIENRVYDEEQEDFFHLESSNSNSNSNNVATVEKEMDKKKNEQETTAEVMEGPSGTSHGSTSVTTLTTSPSTTLEKEGDTKAAAESIVTKYRSALEMGMEAMKLFVMMDEDDKDDTNDTTLSQFDTVLDIYNERPLPFVIGTREFLEDETLGLGAAPEEEESDSDSSSSYTSSYSSSDSGSDSKSDSESLSNASQKSSNRRASHSRSRYRSSSEEPDEALGAEQSTRRRANSDESDTSGLFGRPPMSEPSRRRADSDESDTSGLFGRPSAAASAIPQLKASLSRSSLRRPVFDDDKKESNNSDWTSDSDDDGKKMPMRKQSTASRRGHEAPPPFAVPVSARKNQYLDSSDEESDAGLFGLAPTSKPRVFATDEAEALSQRNTSKQPNTRRSDSFDSSFSDEDKGMFGASVEKKAPTAEVPRQRFRLPPMDATTSRRTSELESKQSILSSDSDAESTTSGLFGRPSGAVRDKKKNPANHSVFPASQQSRHLDFFDDSSDDDDDGGLFGAAPAIPSTPVVQPVVSTPRHSTYSNSSSDDDGNGGDLFGATPTSARGTTAAPSVSASRLKPVQRAPQSGLFGESDSDDSDDSDISEDSDGGGPFGAKKAVTKAAAPVAASRPSLTVKQNASDSDNGEGFRIPQATKSNATAPIAAVPTQTRQSRVLSDSSDSDKGGLFGAPPSQSAPVSSPMPAPISAPIPATTASVPPANPFVHPQDSSDDDSDDWSDDGGLFGMATSKPIPAKPAAAAPVPATRRAPDSAPTQVVAPTESPAGISVHPPILSAAARLRAAESSSDSDSDSDWDGGLFGPSKK
ncbi:unnamed protein product [Peronospora belbahrii]|uniref:FAM21/CAPZIP domain-containing protein n=1 Tax=Peronospora belbahrii TaxID=622444 RepID=A0ABN8CSA3_9STRA|nr:unnamed protein product [Peronospora belbahrii]